MPDEIAHNKKQVTIGIGEYYASKEPVIIYTLLGSCVAVCLFDPKNRIGGMNHILLPGKPELGKYDDSARYGINAMELLINGIMKLGGDRKSLVAKIFGGANVIPSISEDKAVGQRLVDFIQGVLRDEKIKIISRDYGGYDTRKIFFHSDTGDVFLKRLSSMKTIAKKEQERLDKIKRQIDEPGDVTIFPD